MDAITRRKEPFVEEHPVLLDMLSVRNNGLIGVFPIDLDAGLFFPERLSLGMQFTFCARVAHHACLHEGERKETNTGAV